MKLQGTVTVPNDNRSRLMSAQLSIKTVMKLLEMVKEYALPKEITVMLSNAHTESCNVLKQVVDSSEKLSNEVEA